MKFEPEDYKRKLAIAREILKTGVQVVSSNQLFPTPKDLAGDTVAGLEIQPTERVLEPSAGTGRFVAAIPRCAELVAVEIHPDVARALGQRFADRPDLRIHCADFLTCTPEELGLFDVIVMNPPFERGDDVRHLWHAFRFKKPKGRIRAIMSAGLQHRFDPLHRALRVLIEQHGGRITPLPEGSFASQGTNVRTVLVTV